MTIHSFRSVRSNVVKRKIISAFLTFLLLFQNVAPVAQLSIVMAQDATPVVEQIQPTPAPESTPAPETTPTPEAPPVPAETPTPEAAVEPTSVPVPTPPSDSASAEEPTETPVPAFNPTDVLGIPLNMPSLQPEVIAEQEAVLVEQECILDDAQIKESVSTDWTIDLENSIASTNEKVQLGVKYIFPQENKVSVTFKCLPKDESLRQTLKIQQVKVSELNLPESVKNIEGEFAYDITTEMKNGDFAYDVTLPKSENKNASVSYIEKSIEEAKQEVKTEDFKTVAETDTTKVNQELKGADITATGMDHFTIFVVTTDSPASTGAFCTVNAIAPASDCFNSLAAALAAASSGDTIRIANGEYYETGLIIPSTKTGLIIEGQSKAGVIVHTTAAWGFDIQADSTTLRNLTLIDDSLVDGYHIKAHNFDGFTVEDVVMSGNSYGTGNKRGGLDINSVKNSLVKNVSIANYYKNGYAITSQCDTSTVSENAIIENVSVSEVGWNGFAFQLSSGPSCSPLNSALKGVEFKGVNSADFAGQAAIRVEDTDEVGMTSPLDQPVDIGSFQFGPNNTGYIVNKQKNDLIAVGASFAGVTNLHSYSSELDSVEAKIMHDCVDSAFVHGVCNDSPYELGESFGSVKYASSFPTKTQCDVLYSGSNKMPVCHATSSTSNPYTLVEANCNGIYGGHLNDDGTPRTSDNAAQDHRDDIPALFDESGEPYCPDSTPGELQSISGSKINDVTKAGIEGWKITVCQLSDDFEAGTDDAETADCTYINEVLTGADGSYRFDDLVPGIYKVTEESQPGFSFVTPSSGFYVVDLLTGVSIPAGNLLSNGGFEIPIVATAQNWNIYPTGTAGLGWTVDWTSPDPGLHSGLSRPALGQLELHRSAGGWSPSEHLQHSELDSDWGGPGSNVSGELSNVAISQSVETCKDSSAKFTVSLKYSARPAHADNKIEVLWDGVVVGTYTATGVGKTQTDWQTALIEDLTGTGTTELLIREIGTPDSFGMFVDDVQVTQSTACTSPQIFNFNNAPTPLQCVEEPGWADGAEKFLQGPQKNNQSVPAIRSNPNSVLGSAENSGVDGTFFSLGQGGWLIAQFTRQIIDTDGADISVHEATNSRNSYPQETAKVEVSQNGDDWYEIGAATSTANDDGPGVTLLDFSSTPLSWVQYVRITDTTNFDLNSNSNADGFDIDAIDAVRLGCETLDPDPEPPVYACAETLYAVNNNEKLSWINPISGIVQELSNMNFGSSASADDPFNARTYYVNRYGQGLAYYDHSANSHTTIGNTGVTSPFTKLAFNNTGTLYGLTDAHHLYTINTASGLATDLGLISGVATGGDIVFDENNILYLIGTDGKLFTVDLTTKIASLVKNTGLSTVTGLAYLNGLFYVSTAIASGTQSNVYSMTKMGDTITQLNTEPQALMNDLSSCVPGRVLTSTVEVCKQDSKENPLSNWSVFLKGETVQTGLSVPSNTSPGVSSVALQAGTSYLAEASGSWTNQGGANPVDTEYSTVDGWATQMDGYTGYQTDILELQINNIFDPSSNWGAYNSAHKYAQSFIPSVAGPANFRIFDGSGTTQNEGWFGDNNGSLTVDISKGYAGITGENGCVTFTDVPFGSYTVGEILQDGWKYDSGAGEVAIDSTQETFTIINREIPKPAKLVASKVVCDDEQYLPNNTQGAIGANTAQAWVNQSQGHCQLATNWNFQWSGAGGGSYGAFQTDTATLAPPWNTFAAGQTVEFADTSVLGGRIEVREVFPDNSYVPFTNSGNESAELWCTGDQANYDNWEWINNPQPGQTYYCVAFNAKKTAPRLTLIKKVINDNGGSAAPSAWIVSATGPGPLVQGSGTAVSDDKTFLPGTYTMTESAGPTGYVATAWSCIGDAGDDSEEVNFPINENMITLDYGDRAICTITNDDTFEEEQDTALLQISKSNNAYPAIKAPGDTVKYTLTVTAKEGSLDNVLLTDVPPDGFSYVLGSWTAVSDVRGDIKNSVTTEPTYGSPGDWILGSMEADEVVTLTYDAKIDSEITSGIHPDLAYAYGNQLDGPIVYAAAQDPGFISEDFVGTQVQVAVNNPGGTLGYEVEREETVTGQVLGASTELPATGMPLTLPLIGLGMFITGLLSLVAGLFIRRRHALARAASGLGVALLILIGLVTPASAYDSLSIRVEQLPSPYNQKEFKLRYVVLDIDNRTISIECFKKAPSAGGFTQFGATTAIQAGGDNHYCNVTSDLTGEAGTYQFYVRAIPNGGVAITSPIQAVDLRTNTGPGTPTNYSRDRQSCKDKLTFRSADDGGKTARIEVYRSDNKSFTADSGSRIDNFGASSNENFSKEYDRPDCGKTYYYVLRAFDSANNGSGLVGDTETIVTTVNTTTTTTTTQATGALPVLFDESDGGAPARTGGSILGAADLFDDVTDLNNDGMIDEAELAAASESAKVAAAAQLKADQEKNQAASQGAVLGTAISNFFSSIPAYVWWILGAILIVLLIAGAARFL